MAPPLFIVCDDVRLEIGGKFTLVGVYPGNIIAVPQVPFELFFHIWAVLWPMEEGEKAGVARVRNEQGKVVFETPMNFRITLPNTVMPFSFVAGFNANDLGAYETQIRMGDEDWLSLGAFRIEKKRMPQPPAPPLA